VDGLDILGATLADQYIVLRIKGIDRDRLKAKLAGWKGAIASSAVQAVDASAAGALNLGLPIAVNMAKDYGVDLEATFSDVPKNMRSHALSEFWPGLGIGIALGAASLAIVKLVSGLASRVVSSK